MTNRSYNSAEVLRAKVATLAAAILVTIFGGFEERVAAAPASTSVWVGFYATLASLIAALTFALPYWIHVAERARLRARHDTNPPEPLLRRAKFVSWVAAMMLAAFGALLVYWAAFPNPYCGGGGGNEECYLGREVATAFLAFPLLAAALIAAAVTWLTYFGSRRERGAVLIGPWTSMLALAVVLLFTAAAIATGLVDAVVGTATILAWLVILFGVPVHLVRKYRRRRGIEQDGSA